MTSLSPARTYPMRYGGGLLLCCVGAAIVLGALLGTIAPLLGAGFCLGLICIFAARPLVAVKFGTPTRRDVRLMYAAIAFELAGFAVLSVCTSNGVLPETNQFIWPAVLFIVAVHFLLMVWSFGAWILYLGLAILAWLALAWVLHFALGVTLIGDGVLKIGFGAIMAAPLFVRGPSPGSDAG